MSLFRPTELRTFLDSLSVTAKKSLSQNFLVDGNIVKKILQSAEITPGDYVLEIGPGPGVLTEALLQAGAEVLAVEKDSVFARNLSRFKGLEIYSGDILEFPFEILKRKAKIVSNLPYHLTTPILERIIPRHDLFEKITVMVQEEVARKMTAESASSDHSPLSLFLKFYSAPHYSFFVSRSCFYPKPKVDSAIVVLDTKEPPDIDAKEFFTLIKAVFQKRRKMLRNSLKQVCNLQEISSVLQIIDSKARPEELSLSTFLEIFKILNNNDPS